MSKLSEMLHKAVPVQEAAATKSTVMSISIVYNRNGKRVTLSKRLYEELGTPGQLQFMINAEDKKLFISQEFPEVEVGYEILNPEKPIIYNSGLTRQLAESFELDFEACSSHSFQEIVVEQLEDGTPVAVVSIEKN